MKAISVRQPWAELIIQGKKTVEIRKLNTGYRGDLLIHAASIRGVAEFAKANINPKTKSSFDEQSFVGVVELKDIVCLNSKLWNELREQHLLPDKWLSDKYRFAWILDNPRRIKPIHYVGLPAIFSVSEKIVSSIKVRK
jgi:hypothetical protein